MTPAAFALLTLGAHHGDEVPDSTGDTKWLALVQVEGRWALEEARVAVSPVEDPVLDDGSGPPTGRQVSTPDLVAEPVVLLRGPGLTAGPLTTAVEPLRPLFPGDTQPVSLPGTDPLTLQATGQVSLTEWGRTQLQRYGLVATAGPKVVPLFPEASLDAEGDMPKVIYAGDLDRDGRLDLLVDTSDHYNVSSLTLFLSSQAKRGMPLVAVATYRTTGA